MDRFPYNIFKSKNSNINKIKSIDNTMINNIYTEYNVSEVMKFI